jgi:BirA family transcriptional regulator, biotin operon repressor / biotin---[acetyl-CoA-carboxylase] ligase
MTTPPIAALPCIERYLYFDSLASTNTLAKNMTEFPAHGLFVLHARRQTAGRGQRDNSFFSDVNGGLYASCICPVADMSEHFSVNRALSCAICEAVEHAAPGPALSIKWPNDLYCSGKKLCGILLESALHSARHVVAGFGVNVNIAPDDFPADIRGIATSVCIESGKTIDADRLLADILTRFSRLRQIPLAEAHSRYTARLYKTGAHIEVNAQQGIFTTVQEDGRLLLKTENGAVSIFSGAIRFLD